MAEPPEIQLPKIVCPTCGQDIDANYTLWTLQGKWYCSEKCVRGVLKKGGALR